jgi:hypothetical protein
VGYAGTEERKEGRAMLKLRKQLKAWVIHVGSLVPGGSEG